MTLGNMRQLGVQRLIAFCLNDAYRHQGLIDVSNYADDVDVPFFATKVVCANAALVDGTLMSDQTGKSTESREDLVSAQQQSRCIWTMATEQSTCLCASSLSSITCDV